MAAERAAGSSVGTMNPANTIVYGFCISPDVGCDDRKGRCHRLNNGVGESFTARGQDEDVSVGKMLAQIRNAADETKMIGQIEITNEGL